MDSNHLASSIYQFVILCVTKLYILLVYPYLIPCQITTMIHDGAR